MITVLSEADIAAAGLSDAAIRSAVEAGLEAQAAGAALAEPTVLFGPVPGRDDLIAVVRGALPARRLAMVKSVGGFAGNAARNLPTNPGSLTLIETQTGSVTALIPAAPITTQRTAMVGTVGAALLARPGAGVVGCIGTAGIAVQTVRYIARQMPLTEIRLHGRDPDRTAAAAAALADELATPVIAARDRMACLGGADILIDGAALARDEPLFPAEAFGPGALVIVFGAYSALPPGFLRPSDVLVMDRWVDDGRGALGPLARAGTVSEARVDALIGDVIAGRRSPRRTPRDRIVFCHRGVAACDLTLAAAYLEAAARRGLGATVAF